MFTKLDTCAARRPAENPEVPARRRALRRELEAPISDSSAAKSAGLFDLDAFAPGRTYFATGSCDRLALKLRPRHDEAGQALEGACLNELLPRRLLDGRIAAPSDAGDEFGRLIDMADACVAGRGIRN